MTDENQETLKLIGPDELPGVLDDFERLRELKDQENRLKKEVKTLLERCKEHLEHAGGKLDLENRVPGFTAVNLRETSRTGFIVDATTFTQISWER
jgi:hypothetical protein